ncbi:MAG: SurA N-terminal domain-containing protein, partial [Rikenellaceae bacterium]|nr:SurA N-terminal domain-containing protein [Rikenellaceae bacterium]
MATLNTLRTKGGVILAVIIGISLLAFLLGDLANSGGVLLGSSKMNVGQINGQTVTYQEYLAQVERITRAQQIATGTENLSEQQRQQVRNAAWESIARQLSFNESLENLGLIVTDDELTDMVTGQWVSPIVSSIFRDPQTGVFDPGMLSDYVAHL